MTIALDYDGTFTADPAFWMQFVRNAGEWRQVGLNPFRILLITSRPVTMVIDQEHGSFFHEAGVRVVYSAGRPKRQAAEAVGIKVDIWIDDMPETIGTGHGLALRPEELRITPDDLEFIDSRPLPGGYQPRSGSKPHNPPPKKP